MMDHVESIINLLYLQYCDHILDESDLFLNLGLSLSLGSITDDLTVTLSNETITLCDGTKINQQQLFLKSIQLNPNNSCAYCYLGIILSPNETITLHDGTEMNQKKLILKSIQLNSNNSHAFLSLGLILSLGETITLHDGTEMNQQQLYLKSIQLNPNNSDAFFHLGNTVSLGETITLHDGTEMNQQQLYLKSIQLNPNNSITFLLLGVTLSPNETITLHDGTEMNKQQIFLKSIQLNPNNSDAYFLLGYTLSLNEKIILHNGTETDKQQLYLISVNINNNENALFALYEILSSDQTVKLYGKKFSKRELLGLIQKPVLFEEKLFDSVKHKIGEGGFGCVWKTKSFTLDRMVALKELKKGYSFYNFNDLNEVKYIQRLRDHPDSFVYCYGFINQLEYMKIIVMELMSHSLKDEIYRNTMRNVTEEKVIKSVANGLEILRKFKLVHRDINPKNILIGFNKEVKIADFGLVELECNLKSTLNPGTLIYQAPELIQNTENPITIAADIYSLGITIIEMNIKQILKLGPVVTLDLSKDKWTFKKKLGGQISDTLMMDSHKDNLGLMNNEKLKNIAIGCIQDNPSNRLSPTDIINLLNILNKI